MQNYMHMRLTLLYCYLGDKHLNLVHYLLIAYTLKTIK